MLALMYFVLNSRIKFTHIVTTAVAHQFEGEFMVVLIALKRVFSSPEVYFVLSCGILHVRPIYNARDNSATFQTKGFLLLQLQGTVLVVLPLVAVYFLTLYFFCNAV